MRWVLVLVAAAGASLFAGYMKARQGVRTIKLSYTSGGRPSAQTAPARLLHKLQWQKAVTIAGADGIGRPLVARVGRGGEIFVLDWKDFRVKAFSPSGQAMRAFGAGRAQFANPTDFALGPGSSVWVADPRLSELVGFDLNGVAARVLHLAVAPLRVAVAPSGFVVMPDGSHSALLERFGFSGQRGVNFGTIISNQRRYSIALDGWLAVDTETGNILFTGLHEGVLASFRPDGRTNYIVSTIDPVSLPPVRVTQTGLMTLLGQTAALSLSVDDGTAFVLAGTHPRGGAVPLVDEYDARDGSYLASFPAPENCHQVIARGRELYTVSSTGVTVWRKGSS